MEALALADLTSTAMSSFLNFVTLPIIERAMSSGSTIARELR
jgi:hypothetical protein